MSRTSSLSPGACFAKPVHVRMALSKPSISNAVFHFVTQQRRLLRLAPKQGAAVLPVPATAWLSALRGRSDVIGIRPLDVALFSRVGSHHRRPAWPPP